MMSNYSDVVTSCLQRGMLWEDPEFPASQFSVFYHQTPPLNFVWQRPSELIARPSFIEVSDTTQYDIVPGRMGDNWLVSCFRLLYLTKGLFDRVVPPNQTFEGLYCGVFRFRLWWRDQWVEVLVDDRLPTINDRWAFIHSENSEQMWPALLEKAYAKLHGSYEALKYGNHVDALTDLTGGTVVSSLLFNDVRFLNMLLSTTSVLAFTRKQTTQPSSMMNFAIYYYRLLEIFTISNGPVTTHMVKLCNYPDISNTISTSQVELDESIWFYYKQRERESLMSTPSGFWMEFTKFQLAFKQMEVIHLHDEISTYEPTLHNKTPWFIKTHQGAWRRGVTAGGCKNDDFFHMNPQLVLTLNKVAFVVFSLSQHSVTDPKVIGFTVYNINYRTEIVTASLLNSMKPYLKSEYTNNRHANRMCTLAPGMYLIIPSTFKPREEATFTLKVISNAPLDLNVLDCPAQMLKTVIMRAPRASPDAFAHYETAFMQLADDQQTVDAFNLQELLEVCLPNDYIKSCATIETCRHIVITMDMGNTGRITLDNFKDLMCSLKYWQLAFRQQSREKIGIIIAERLRDALTSLGFMLPEAAISSVILRYMRKDCTFRFGDFVMVILHLHKIFRVFHDMDGGYTGSMRLNISEWLKCSLMF